MIQLGSIEFLPLRSVWPHEARDFTVWLQANLFELNRVTGLELISAEREQFTTNFRVDLVADDSVGRRVIIENQLAPSDHDHLGKFITYAAELEANVAIWIVSHAREEHQKALLLLNENLAMDFYLIQVAAIRIGNSSPAPFFTKIVGPTNETKNVGRFKRDQNVIENKRQKFWEALLELTDSSQPPFKNAQPTIAPWLKLYPSWPPIAGCAITLQNQRSYLRLTIKDDPATPELAAGIYQHLFAHKQTIEPAIGFPLDWHSNQGRQSSYRIDVIVDDTIGLNDDQANWPNLHKKLISAAILTSQTLQPYFEQVITS